MKYSLEGSYPSSLTFNSNQRKIKYSSTSYRDIGEYLFGVKVTFLASNQYTYTPLYYQLFVYSNPPVFYPALKNLTVEAEKKTRYKLPDCVNEVNEIATVTVLKGTVDFVKVDYNVITINPAVENKGEYIINIVCSDALYPLISNTFKWKITVIEPSVLIDKKNSSSSSSNSTDTPIDGNEGDKEN